MGEWRWTIELFVDMQVAWEELPAQAQANCGLAQVALQVNASALDDLARAINRIMAEALLMAMSRTHDCCEPPYRDELQAWYQDAHEVAAVGTALVWVLGRLFVAAAPVVWRLSGACRGLT